MIESLVVIAAIAVVVGAFVLGRRNRPTIFIDTSGKRYELLLDGKTAWAGDDSREASKAIESAREKGIAWQLLVDGVEKKRG